MASRASSASARISAAALLNLAHASANAARARSRSRPLDELRRVHDARRCGPGFPAVLARLRRRRRPSSPQGRRHTWPPANRPGRIERSECRSKARVKRGGVEEGRPPLGRFRVPGETAPKAAPMASGGKLSMPSLPEGGMPPHYGPLLPFLVHRIPDLGKQVAQCGRARPCAATARHASQGDPLDSYQSAARKCSFLDVRSASGRRSRPSRNSRKSAW